MIRKGPAFIFGIVTLSLEMVATIIMLFIYKMSDSLIEALALALWSWPLLILSLITLVLAVIRMSKREEKTKRDIAALIMGIVSLIYFGLYAIMLGFLIGTGQLPFSYL